MKKLIIIPVFVAVILSVSWWVRDHPSNEPGKNHHGTAAISVGRGAHTLHGLKSLAEDPLLAWLKSYQGRPSPELLKSGESLADERRVRLLALFRQDPDAALAAMFSLKTYLAFPPSIRTRIEQPFSTLARIEAYPKCAEPQNAVRRAPDLYATIGSERLHLNQIARAEELFTQNVAPLSGFRIDREALLRPSGVWLIEAEDREAAARLLAPPLPPQSEATLLVGNRWISATRGRVGDLAGIFARAVSTPGPRNAQSILLALASNPEAPLSELSAALSAVTTDWTHGTKRVLYIRLDFPDKPLGEDFFTQLPKEVSSASAFIDNATHGQTSLLPTFTAKIYRLETSDTYEFDESVLAADATAAASVDYNLDEFDFVTFVFPEITTYAWSGLGMLGGSNQWLNGVFDAGLIAHETGHNYGLGHANSWMVGPADNPADPLGSTNGYGNVFDVMGFPYPAYPANYYSAPQKARIGWIDSASIVTVLHSGTHRLYRNDHRDALGGGRILELSIPSGGAAPYAVEYKRNFPERQQGVLIHRVALSAPELLDFTPATEAVADAALPVGQTFFDPSTSLRVTPVAQGGVAPYEYIDVEVAFEPPGYPVITSQTGAFQVAAPGGELVLSVTAASPSGSTAYQWKRNGTVVSGATGSSLTLTNVARKDAGYYQALVTNEAGTSSTTPIFVFVAPAASQVVAWGANDYGQTTVPSGLKGVIAIAAGAYHGLALKTNGGVVAWGAGNYGQATVPGRLTGVVAVAGGGYHSLALKADGTVAAWGANYYSQTMVPAGLTGVVAISAGFDHSLALKADGTVVAWGDDYYGQLEMPVGLTGVVAISAGFDHSLALKADGTVVAWGADDYGQAKVPSGLTGVVAIAAGYYHSLALKADGTIVAWGYNSSGQTIVPSGLTGVVATAAGAYHSLVLKAGGTVAAWGYNNYGQTTVPGGLNQGWELDGGVYWSMVLRDTIPVVSSAGTAVGTAGTAFKYTVTASDAPTGFGVSGLLPAGLALDTTTGVISGTPTQAGVFTLILTATNGSGSSKGVQLTLTIAVPQPSNLGAQRQKAGSAISLSLASAGAPAGLTYQATGLPAGLVLTSTSGNLAGTIASPPGTYAVTYWAQLGATQSSPRTLTWTVDSFPSALTGKYEGLFVAAADSLLPVAKLEITVGSTGAFTGRLTQGTPAITAVSGQLTLDASEAYATLTSFTDGAYTVRVLKVSTTAGAKLTAKLRKGASTTTLGTLTDGVKIKTFTTASPAPWQGAYSAAFSNGANLDPATIDRAAPEGAGYATGAVGVNGTLTLKGKLADRTAITGSFAANSSGSYRLFVQPYATANNYFAGWLKLTSWASKPSPRYRVASGDSLDFYWRKTANSSDAAYPKGFGPLALSVQMATWIPPSSGTPLVSLLGLASADAAALSLKVSGSGLTSAQRTALSAPAKLTLKNNLNVTDSAKALLWPSLNLATSSGKLTGSILVEDTVTTSRTAPWEGVLVQLPAGERNKILGQGFYILAPPADTTGTLAGGGVLLTAP